MKNKPIGDYRLALLELIRPSGSRKITAPTLYAICMSAIKRQPISYVSGCALQRQKFLAANVKTMS